jgi:hypothetical protein
MVSWERLAVRIATVIEPLPIMARSSLRFSFMPSACPGGGF